MLSPEVQGALIGVGALGGAWTARHGFEYLRWKLTGNNGNGKCGGNGHCKDHNGVIQILKELKESHEDEKQVDIMVRAIKRANGSDPRE